MEETTSEEDLVAGLLIHFLRCLPANAHDIGELQLVKKDTFQGKQRLESKQCKKLLYILAILKLIGRDESN